MEIAKVTSKGQITIPKEVRDDLGLDAGSKVLFVQDRDRWIILGTRQLKQPTGEQPKSRTMNAEEKHHFLRELSAKYDIDYDKAIAEHGDKSFEELFSQLQRGFEGVAEESGWKSEDVVVDYIKRLRRGELD